MRAKKTLCEQFIMDKCATFSPATKAGKLRCVPIGLISKTKYVAALHLALLDTDPKVICKSLDVPIQRLRVWKTEPAFTRQIELFQREFANTITMALVEVENAIKRGSKPPSLDKLLADKDRYQKQVVQLLSKQILQMESQFLSQLYILRFGSEKHRRGLDRHLLLYQLASLNTELATGKPLNEKQLLQIRQTLDWAYDFVLDERSTEYAEPALFH